MWKILAAQIREEINYLLINRGLLPKEQKGCRKGTRGIENLQYIDQPTLKENKLKRKNVAMAWIDNTKAYEVVPQSWIIGCLKI